MDVNIQEFLHSPTSPDWWKEMRRSYNTGFMIAGGIAFAFYCVVMLVWVFPREPNAEISGASLLFLLFVYLLMMGIANMIYNLGPALERILEPEDKAAFRKRMYALEYWLSFSLPFTIPLLVFALYL